MGQPVIAWPVSAHYHRYNRTQARAMTNGTAADIERRLNDGAWLKPGEVAVLFDRSRWAVVGWLKNGLRIGGERYYLGYRETVGGHREIDPHDVRAALDAYRTVRQRRTAEPND
jgi:hypothetical protein